jgi:hypothetical protein
VRDTAGGSCPHGQSVVVAPEEITATHELPYAITVDHGIELTSKVATYYATCPAADRHCTPGLSDRALCLRLPPEARKAGADIRACACVGDWCRGPDPRAMASLRNSRLPVRTIDDCYLRITIFSCSPLFSLRHRDSGADGATSLVEAARCRRIGMLSSATMGSPP